MAMEELQFFRDIFWNQQLGPGNIIISLALILVLTFIVEQNMRKASITAFGIYLALAATQLVPISYAIGLLVLTLALIAYFTDPAYSRLMQGAYSTVSTTAMSLPGLSHGLTGIDRWRDQKSIEIQSKKDAYGKTNEAILSFKTQNRLKENVAAVERQWAGKDLKRNIQVAYIKNRARIRDIPQFRGQELPTINIKEWKSNRQALKDVISAEFKPHNYNLASHIGKSTDGKTILKESALNSLKNNLRHVNTQIAVLGTSASGRLIDYRNKLKEELEVLSKN